MTSPRPYGGGYSSPSFPDTPIYDRLVAERGTPQIAPIRVPAAYEPLGYPSAAAQPALPALPALPSAPSPTHAQPHPQAAGGYPGYQAAPARPQLSAPAPQAPAPYFPQQAATPRPYQAPGMPQAPVPQQMRPAAPRPAAPRQMPGQYQQQGQQHPYPNQQQQHQYPSPGYWAEPGTGH
ncbi:DUF6643 family protein [Streptomyces millisiae]|uniref:DUF6643 family protein n=1 Tax=Streptomyces millisiae TaxID=3075542 RepID=A0ABU2LGR2_9ACTN|nr:DUF6643 family protein [Streptomyces sp. DSM 44918]MDT0316780.1 DUF6643 family protein [Streptomyces sp. DSM 44918]